MSWPVNATQRPSPVFELSRELEQESTVHIKPLGHGVNHFQKVKRGNFEYWLSSPIKTEAWEKPFHYLRMIQIQGACHRADKEIPDLRNSANDTEICCKNFRKTRKWLNFRNVNLSTERLRNREKKMRWNETPERKIERTEIWGKVYSKILAYLARLSLFLFQTFPKMSFPVIVELPKIQTGIFGGMTLNS